MKRQVYRAFDADQIALLESLRKKSKEDKSEPTKRQRDFGAPNNLSQETSLRPGAIRSAPSRAASNLTVDPAHATRARMGDFSWIPILRNQLIEHMLRTKTSIHPRRDQLIIVGHIYWKLIPNSKTSTDTIYIDSQPHKVSISRIDAAVEHAFSDTYLAWIARISRGEAVAWEPVYVRFLKTGQLTKSRELHFTTIPKRSQALQAALRSGLLCLAVLRKEHAPTRSRVIEKKKPSRPKKITFTTKPSYFSTSRRPSTHQDGSALILASTDTKASARSASSGSSASNLPSKTILPEHSENRPYVLELCSRCGGGELPNCPQCDGTGYFKLYETESPSDIIMKSTSAMSGHMSAPTTVGNPSSVADHEAVGRSDPLDANRSTSGIRDGGQFGSMPLHDNYDN
ncbi:MAG: hypothetical protein WBF84_17065 [Castellaniella sp.]|uniref:hypothetical protein n=1 Tax=Castellaniella sp. TaxID=1955812 RepID=UPI003C75315B